MMVIKDFGVKQKYYKYKEIKDIDVSELKISTKI